MIGGPGGVGAIPGPWYNFIPSTGKNKDLAKQYVQFAYDHNDLGIQAPLGLAARISAYQGYASKPGLRTLQRLDQHAERSPNTGQTACEQLAGDHRPGAHPHCSASPILQGNTPGNLGQRGYADQGNETLAPVPGCGHSLDSYARTFPLGRSYLIG